MGIRKKDITEFEGYLSLRCSRVTIRNHKRTLNLLLKHLPNFVKSLIDAFLASEKTRGISNAQINKYICTIRKYAQFQNLNPELQNYPFVPKRNIQYRATFTDEEIEQFIHYTPKTREVAKTRRKMDIFWMLAAYTGLRPAENSHILRSDFDFPKHQIIIRAENAKTREAAVIPIPSNIEEDLKNYIEHLKGEYLFPTERGGYDNNRGECVISAAHWEYDFNKRVKILGINRPGLKPYSFRDSFATTLIANDMSVFKVKRLMRHTNLNTTLIYEKMTTEHLRDSVTRTHPNIRQGSDPQNILNCIVSMLQSLHLEKDVRFSYHLEEKENSVKFEVYIK